MRWKFQTSQFNLQTSIEKSKRDSQCNYTKNRGSKKKNSTAIKGNVLVILAYLHLVARLEHHPRRPQSKSPQAKRRQPLWKLNPEAPPSLTFRCFPRGHNTDPTPISIASKKTKRLRVQNDAEMRPRPRPKQRKEKPERSDFGRGREMRFCLALCACPRQRDTALPLEGKN